MRHQKTYNQEISKYKLLSSTAGVGALINTKMGFNIIIHNIEQWFAVSLTDRKIESLKDECDTKDLIQRAKFFNDTILNDPLWHKFIDFVEDLRFLKFLKQKYGYPSMELFVAIPDISVHEKYNSVTDPHGEVNRKQDHDDLKKIFEVTIPASHFPKTFYNTKGKLAHISFWAENAANNGFSIEHFVPPFDIPKDEKNKAKLKKGRKKKTDNTSKPELKDVLTIPLKQINLLLICKEGHLSEIPWSKYIYHKRNSTSTLRGPVDLFALNDCCKDPDLYWSESTQRSEGFGSIHIECKNCKELGLDHKYRLEGITSMKVICRGHMPWTLPINDSVINNKFSRDLQANEPQIHQCSEGEMQVTLATANNVYYANNTSSLYIPYDLAQRQSVKLLTIDMVNELHEKFKGSNKTRENNGDQPQTQREYLNEFITIDRLIKMKWETQTLPPTYIAQQINEIKDRFLNLWTEPELTPSQLMTEYRKEEFNVFHRMDSYASKELSFKKVTIPDSASSFFDVISCVEALKITSVQLNFSRVESIPLTDQTFQNGQSGQNIHVVDKTDVKSLPAIQSLGEGIFFSIDQTAIERWLTKFRNKLFEGERSSIFNKTDHYQNERNKVRDIKERFFLVHTLSHLLMKELEFSCGYPVASLKERLYISNEMAGFLIFTSEGSEGSMGGLISQTRSQKLDDLINTALNRGELCSSDPICWEGSGSGHASLNLASCFSCSIVSETACEERNLVLDRRILLDNEFGFFRASF